ncbi:hypothetical protein MVEG_12303 [Podila verticillata NRRL 6337]|uniref:Uncharacterized protein n=1 Tax=Podila verticillata NRRL 6337 TaxID=1069443 RepID=A0A086TIU7_9FUNG|nr:hypothetical protein MVEG_12303 [Podila verticillata NRRL 6337]
MNRNQNWPSHSTVTAQEFMETHIKDESKHRIQDIPPFNIPTPHISGPDIVFYVQINGNFHPCFEQLKIRQFLEGSDVEKVLATVSSHAMQEKMDKEQEKMQKDQKKQKQKAATGFGSKYPVRSTAPATTTGLLPDGNLY